jgi:hypothetical protein
VKKVVSLTLVAGCVVVLCILVGSRFPVFGQTSKVGGGFRLMITAANLASIESVALITPGGGFTASVPALGCLASAGASISMVVGNWGVVSNAVGAQFLVFQAMGPVYQGDTNLGELTISGATPLPVSSPVSGTGTAHIPAGLPGCSGLNGKTSIVLIPIPPIAPAV